MPNERKYFKTKQRKSNQENSLNQFNNDLPSVDLYQDCEDAKALQLDRQKKEREITDQEELINCCTELFKKLCLQFDEVKVIHRKEHSVSSPDVDSMSQEEEFLENNEIMMKKLKNLDVWGNKDDNDEGSHLKDPSTTDTQNQDTHSAIVGEIDYLPIICRKQINDKNQRVYTKYTRYPCAKKVNTISKQSKMIQKYSSFRTP